MVLIARISVYLTFSLSILSGFASLSQSPGGSTPPAVIGLFPMPGFEPLPPHKSRVVDKTKFKPENFRFLNKAGKSLEDRLSSNAALETVDCRPSWGLFAFRVNGKGAIDSTWFDGHLPAASSNRILANICATEGSWVIAPGTKPDDVAWFVYFYSDVRALWDKNVQCSEADKELQKAVSSMNGFFYNLFFWLGKDNATMLRPTVIDGLPKI